MKILTTLLISLFSLASFSQGAALISAGVGGSLQKYGAVPDSTLVNEPFDSWTGTQPNEEPDTYS